MTDQTCQNCRHWSLLDECYELPGHGECALTVSKSGQRTVETLAFARDGECYYARLVTLPTFSCNQFHSREE